LKCGHGFDPMQRAMDALRERRARLAHQKDIAALVVIDERLAQQLHRAMEITNETQCVQQART